jgi:hypothetical protein
LYRLYTNTPAKKRLKWAFFNFSGFFPIKLSHTPNARCGEGKLAGGAYHGLTRAQDVFVHARNRLFSTTGHRSEVGRIKFAAVERAEQNIQEP